MEELCKVCRIVGKLKFVTSGVVKAVFQSMPYFSDITTDIALAVRYYREYLDTSRGYYGNYYLLFFALTTTLLAIPWAVVLLLASIWQVHLHETPRLEKLLPIFALFGILPLAVRFVAQTGKFERQKETEHKIYRILATILLIEALFEALPQSLLQIWIVHEHNEADWLVMLGILSSLFTFSKNCLEGYVRNLALGETVHPRFATSTLRQLGFSVIVWPWCLTLFITLIPILPLATPAYQMCYSFLNFGTRFGMVLPYFLLYLIPCWTLFVSVFLVISAYFIFTCNSRIANDSLSPHEWLGMNPRLFKIFTWLFLPPLVVSAYYLIGSHSISYLHNTNPYNFQTAPLSTVTKFFLGFEVKNNITTTNRNMVIKSFARHCNFSSPEYNSDKICPANYVDELFLFFFGGQIAFVLYSLVIAIFWQRIENRLFPYDADAKWAAEGPLERLADEISTRTKPFVDRLRSFAADAAARMKRLCCCCCRGGGGAESRGDDDSADKEPTKAAVLEKWVDRCWKPIDGCRPLASILGPKIHACCCYCCRNRAGVDVDDIEMHVTGDDLETQSCPGETESRPREMPSRPRETQSCPPI